MLLTMAMVIGLFILAGLVFYFTSNNLDVSSENDNLSNTMTSQSISLAVGEQQALGDISITNTGEGKKVVMPEGNSSYAKIKVNASGQTEQTLTIWNLGGPEEKYETIEFGNYNITVLKQEFNGELTLKVWLKNETDIETNPDDSVEVLIPKKGKIDSDTKSNDDSKEILIPKKDETVPHKPVIEASSASDVGLTLPITRVTVPIKGVQVVGDLQISAKNHANAVMSTGGGSMSATLILNTPREAEKEFRVYFPYEEEGTTKQEIIFDNYHITVELLTYEGDIKLSIYRQPLSTTVKPYTEGADIKLPATFEVENGETKTIREISIYNQGWNAKDVYSAQLIFESSDKDKTNFVVLNPKLGENHSGQVFGEYRFFVEEVGEYGKVVRLRLEENDSLGN